MATQKLLAERRREMNEGLFNDVKEIKELLLAMQKAEAARSEREKGDHEDLAKLKEAVNGNGKPGLKTDVELLKVNDRKRTSNQNTIIIAIIIQIIMMILTKVL